MKFIDLHCDTISLMANKGSEGLYSNSYSVDIEKLIKGDALAQFFALYFPLKKVDNAYGTAIKLYDKFKEEIDKNSQYIRHVRNHDELVEVQNQGKIGAFLTIEEGGAIEGDINKLNEFYEKGVRLITLTWNYENEIGFPHKDTEFSTRGLKPFGIEVINKMNSLGMVIDVSHLNDAGFYDVVKYSKKPFVASHSNSRTVRNVSRNLTDDMIKKLSLCGGVTGLNFCLNFMGDGDITTINHMIEHIKHIVNVGGMEVMALGSDFDGIGNKVEIEDASKMGDLAWALNKAGFSEDSIEKIFYKNALRVIKDVMK